MSDVRTIRVFIASPGDLAPERLAFREVLDALNPNFGHGARVKFEPLGWEDTVSPVGRRPQSEFNAEVEKCDVFFLVLWRRWGQEVPDVTPPATSYTEEEFNVATARLARTGKREPIIHALFKKVHPDFLADPGKQLQKVLDFKTRLAKSGEAITLSFDDEPGFRKQADRLLRDAAHQLTAPPVAASVVTAPVALPEEELKAMKAELAEQRALSARLLEELKELRRPAGKQSSKAAKSRDRKTTRTRAKVASLNNEIGKLELAERAAQAALDGRLDEARRGFTQATGGTNSSQVLYLAYEFYSRTGDLTMAESFLERWLALSDPGAQTAETAAALGNLGLIHQTRGDLGRAEELHWRALAINERVGHREGVAVQYGNLGLVNHTRGDLDRAEEMHRKALAVNEAIGRQVGVAIQCGNLGEVYRERGDLGRAEEMYRKALAVNEALGRQEGVAVQCGNLGLVYRERGDLGRAEELHRKALAVNEAIGRQEGIAAQSNYLGSLLRRRGELDPAEAWLTRALELSERLQFREYQADALAGLGEVARDRGNRPRARELWLQARERYARIGMPHKVQEMTDWLDQLPPAADA